MRGFVEITQDNAARVPMRGGLGSPCPHAYVNGDESADFPNRAAEAIRAKLHDDHAAIGVVSL